MKEKITLIFIIILALALRLHQLGANPPSLYWDEASLGYNGWSVSQNLKDEHGDFLPITNFKAFGDYKPPVYIYLAATSIKIFGFNEFAVRFPSAFFGVISVFCTYFIFKSLIEYFRVGVAYMRPLPLLSSFFLAISPWAINLSHVAFEANVALGFFLIGLVIFLRYIVSDRSNLPYLSHLMFVFLIPIFFVLPFYTFNSSRIFIPIFLFILLFFFYKKIINKKKIFLFSLLTFILFLAPLVPHLVSKEGRLRFNEVNIFTNPVPIEISNSRIARDNSVLWSKVINNRRLYIFEDYLKHFTDNFKGDFLFLRGDVNATFSTRRNGELYILDLILAIGGIYFLWFKSKKLCIFLLIWLFAGIAPSGVARETPHALRSLNLFPIYQIFASFGVWLFLKKISHIRRTCLICLMVVISANFSFYLFNYYNFYPKEQSKYFQYGYKELVEYVNQNKNKYDRVLISSIRGRPYIYFLFYGRVPEEKFRENSEIVRNDFGFYNVNRFENIYFVEGAIVGNQKTLTVGAPEEFGDEKNFNVIKKIKYLDGSDNFWIVKN